MTWKWNKVENLQSQLLVLFLFIFWIARCLYSLDFVSFSTISKISNIHTDENTFLGLQRDKPEFNIAEYVMFSLPK